MQEIGSEVDVISSAHISELQLTVDVTKPIIGIQRLFRLVEGRGIETHEIPQSNHRRLVLVLVLVLVLILELINNSLHEHLVHLKLLHHCGHVVRRRGWIVGTTTTSTTTTTSHPAKIRQGHFRDDNFIEISKQALGNAIIKE